MTYLEFHFVFTLPWLAVLAGAAVWARRNGRPMAGPERSDRFALLVLLAHLVMAFVYTTPWDNYLVYREVWGYPPGRVWFTVGYVPIEEYAFFVIQTAASGLALFALLRSRRWERFAGPLPGVVVRWAGASIFMVAAVVGAAALAWPSGTYLGLIVAWAAPILAIQWGFGGDFLVRRWRLVATAIALPTVWLWCADWTAIQLGIWWISPSLTTGIAPFGLPIEEALFFLVTNMLVVFGMTMALDPQASRRAADLWRRRGAIWQWAILGWVVAMVPAPLLPDRFLPLAYLSTGLLVIATLVPIVQRFGARAWWAFACAVTFGWAIEAIGTATGIPFGRYDYLNGGPTFLGVPLLVPLGWWAFVVVAMSVAPVQRRWLWAPVALVTWDVGLDPLMVDRGVWAFASGAWFGVPLSNFVGWFVSGMILVRALTWIEPRLATSTIPAFRVVYLVQAGFIGVGLTLFGLPWAGLVAAVVMASFAAWSWRSST